MSNSADKLDVEYVDRYRFYLILYTFIALSELSLEPAVSVRKLMQGMIVKRMIRYLWNKKTDHRYEQGANM